MVEPMFHKEKIMTIGNILREIRKSVNKKSQMSLRDMLVLARLYYPLWVSRRVDTWHIVYLSYKDPCPKISVHKSEIKVPFKMSHGQHQHGQRWNLREFTASCKVVPLGRATFWMLKLVNFHRCPCCLCDI